MHRCPNCGHVIPLKEILTAADFVTFHCPSCDTPLQVDRTRYFRLVTLGLLITLALTLVVYFFTQDPSRVVPALVAGILISALITIPLYRIQIAEEKAGGGHH